MERADDHHAGFTLIEIMVVVTIIAILVTIALPTFLGARQRAQNRGTQAGLRNAFSAAKVSTRIRRPTRASTLPRPVSNPA